MKHLYIYIPLVRISCRTDAPLKFCERGGKLEVLVSVAVEVGLGQGGKLIVALNVSQSSVVADPAMDECTCEGGHD